MKDFHVVHNVRWSVGDGTVIMVKYIDNADVVEDNDDDAEPQDPKFKIWYVNKPLVDTNQQDVNQAVENGTPFDNTGLSMFLAKDQVYRKNLFISNEE